MIQKKVQKHIDELLSNFEEDIIRSDLTSAMAELATLERNKPATDADRSVYEKTAHELMKQCQVLGIRLAVLTQKRA